MSVFFPNSDYTTPRGVPQSLLSRLFGLRALPFYWGMSSVVLHARKLALQNNFDGQSWAQHSRDIMAAAERNGARIHITGFDEFRTVPGPVVFIGNHMSTLETFIFPCIIQPDKPLTFIVKESLCTHAVFGPVMRSRDPVTVTRTDPRKDLKAVLAGGAERLKAGISMCVFPQSTRKFEFEPAHFNTIGVKLARRANVPVVPVAVRTDYWGNGKMIKDFGPVARSRDVFVAFGKAIPADEPQKSVHQQVLDFLKKRLPEWGVPWIEEHDECHPELTDLNRNA